MRNKLEASALLIFLVGWEVIARAGVFSPFIFPSISGSVLWSIENYMYILDAAWATLRLLLISIFVSTVVSLIMGGLASISKSIRAIVETFTSIFIPIPSVSLLPFALLWFGLGEKPIIFITSFGAIWIFTLNIINGFATVNKTLIDVGRNFGLESWKMVWHILIPSAFPSILTGFKSAWAVSWRTVVAAELVLGAVGMKGGLGWVIYCQRFMFNPNGMMAALMCISLIGILMENVLLETIENKTIKRWGMKV